MNNEERILSILENIQGKVGSMESRFDTLEGRFDTLEGRFDTLEKNTNKRFEALEGRFDTLEGRFDTLEGRFDTLENRFDTMEKNTNDKFKSIEKLIAEETQLTRDELKAEIQFVYDKVETLKDDINIIEQNTAKNSLDISRIKSVMIG